MHREINLDSIRTLERRIREHPGPVEAIIRLKRTRNSLLNVSTLLPPEILGSIFRWNTVPDRDFDGVPKGAYNFLLVCHHWFEVASRTPELWSLWGNSMRDWVRRHARGGTGPVDLVLADRMSGRDLDERLCGALRDRAAQDLVRRVHIKCFDGAGIVNSIISSIVTEGEETRSNSVESFIIDNGDLRSVDVSAFFSRYHFPELRRLHLAGCTISSWGLLKSHTAVLTTLKLIDLEKSPILTSSQWLSILSSSLLLQHLELANMLDPGTIDGDRTYPCVPLRHLKRLYLRGGFRPIFALLSRVEYPDKLDDLRVSVYGYSPIDLSQTIGPCLGDRIRHWGRFPGGGLGLYATFGSITFFLYPEDKTKAVASRTRIVSFAGASAGINVQSGKEERERVWLELIATISWEQVTYLETCLPILQLEGLGVKMCNLTHLNLSWVDLSAWFCVPILRRPQANEDVLSSLNHIEITGPTLSGGWGPLTDFLSRRAAIGNRISCLRIFYHPHMGDDVVESIKRAVEVFEDGDLPRRMKSLRAAPKVSVERDLSHL